MTITQYSYVVGITLERCQTGERQLGEWILANGRMEKTGYGQMEEWYDHLSNICSQCQWCQCRIWTIGRIILPFVHVLHRLWTNGRVVQGRAKLMELSLVTHVPSGPIGCAWAGHFAWQKWGGNFKQGEKFFAPRCTCHCRATGRNCNEAARQ